ncbi:MAG: DnaJ domain-containing protein [Rhodospirillales bacterium]|nr:DnaJ domain-containing protein [Rhodospirillales bacterium]
MPYLLLGFALLIGFILVGRWYISAEPKQVLRVIKWLGFSIVVSVLLFFLLTGRLTWALMGIPALFPWFMRLRSAARAAKNFSRMAAAASGQGGATGKTSDVETRFIKMTLDHDSGAMSGRVLEGAYAGDRVEDLSLHDLISLLQTCWTEDQPSAQVLEAYLDRAHDGWRDQAQAESGGQAAGDAMSRDEAFQVLGLEPGASDEDIKEAHRRLIAGLHPDHGGSTYLAAKINRAKDILLGNG